MNWKFFKQGLIILFWQILLPVLWNIIIWGCAAMFGAAGASISIVTLVVFTALFFGNIYSKY